MYFKVFGSKCYVHNNGKQNLGKSDARSDEAVFIGYSSHSKAYKVFNKRTLMIEESVHVIFDETNILNQELQEDDDFEIGLMKKYNLRSSNIEEEPFLIGSKQVKDEEKNEAETELSTLVPEDPVQVPKSNDSEPNEPLADESLTQQSSTSEQTARRSTRVIKDHPTSQIISNNQGVQTRSKFNSFYSNNAFIAKFEPTNVEHVLTDPDWVVAMQDELLQFHRNKVWHLVPKP